MASSKRAFFRLTAFGRAKILAQHVGGEGDGAAGVLLLAQAVEVGGEADLRFHFFFAVAVIVVGDDGDHHAALVAAGHFERAAAVVRLLGIAPEHAVAALALGRIFLVRQAEILLFDSGQMRRNNHAAGVAGPVHHVERGVVFRQIRIARVAENAFDEIQIAHQAARREEADLHRLLRIAFGGGHTMGRSSSDTNSRTASF